MFNGKFVLSHGTELTNVYFPKSVCGVFCFWPHYCLRGTIKYFPRFAIIVGNTHLQSLMVPSRAPREIWFYVSLFHCISRGKYRFARGGDFSSGKRQFCSLSWSYIQGQPPYWISSFHHTENHLNINASEWFNQTISDFRSFAFFVDLHSYNQTPFKLCFYYFITQ